MPEYIDGHSREVQEVMEQPSKWYINIGCTIIAILLILGIISLIKVDLPEIITGRATIYRSIDKEQANESLYSGILKIDELNFSSIKKGMQINLALAGYPVDKYGTLTGTITDFPDSVNPDHTLSVKFILHPQLTTTKDYRPMLLNGMNADVKIVVGSSNFFNKLLKS